MSVSGIRAGRAFVEVFLKDRMTEGLGGLQTRLKTFQIGADRLAGSLFRGGAVLGAPLVLAAKQAASAQEELSRFGAVFGELEGSAAGFADNLADSIGRSPVQIKKAMASFQSLFVGLGFGKKESQGFSQEMQSLALDFASFNNITDEDALERFISGLSGSSEVFARFGINTKASAIDQELLAMGIKATTATATEQQKTLARMNIIRQSMGQQNAIGDAFRTKDSTINQMKRFNAEVEKLAVTVGTQLIPAINPAISKVSELTEMAGEFIARNPEFVSALGYTAAGMLSLAAAVKAVAVAAAGLKGLTTFLQFLKANPTLMKGGLAVLAGGSLAVAAMNEDGSSWDKLKQFLPESWQDDPTAGTQRVKEDFEVISEPIAKVAKELAENQPVMPNRLGAILAGAVSPEIQSPDKVSELKSKLPDPAMLSSAAVLGSGEVISRLLRASRGGIVSQKEQREKEMLQLEKQMLDQLKRLNDTTEENLTTVVG